MSLPSAEALAGSWYPSQIKLLQRPLYGGLAIDPPNPAEVDDALQLHDITSKDSFSASVHIADGALLHGTDAIPIARANGWSMYYFDGTSRLMLPSEYIRPLSLDNPNPDGVPAISIHFDFTKAQGIQNVRLESSRVSVVAQSYGDFVHDYREKDKNARGLVRAAQALARHSQLGGLSGNTLAEDVVGRFMVVTNFVIANTMEKAGVPWLFRNHSKQAYLSWRDQSERENFEKMRVALYGAFALRHEALGLKRYCHFSSPLRRFPDLANHANLSAYLDEIEPVYGRKDMRQIAREMTRLYVERSQHFAARPGQLSSADS